MKAFVFVLTALFCAPLVLAQPANGQGRGPGGGRMFEQYRQVLESLELSDDQKTAIAGINQSAAEKFRTLMDETADLDRRERGERLREFMTDYRQQIDEQLTAEQRETFEQKLQEARQQMCDRGGRGDGGPGRPEPGAGPGPAGRGAVGGRLEEAMRQLNLNEDQRKEADRILEELRNKLAEIRAGAANDPEAAREAAREAGNNAREALINLLDRDQRQQLRESMAAPPGAPDQPRGERRRDEAPPPATGPSSLAPNTQPTASAVGLFVEPPFSLPAGAEAPDFKLTDTRGRQVALSSLRQKPTILVFGSYTSPLFRDRARSINQLRLDAGTRANVYIIYTREAHPEGVWDIERNRDEKIAISPHESDQQRLDVATRTARTLDLSVPVLVDRLDDAVFNAYGRHPNAGVLVGRDGKVLAYQKWFEPHAMRRALEAATAD